MDDSITTEIVKSETPALARVHVFATSADEMTKASGDLSQWFARRLDQERADLAMLEENLALATKNKWHTKGWKPAIVKAKAMVGYYEKAKTAVDAGYTIIPDLNADWFALRTTKTLPPRNEETNRGLEPREKELDLPPAPAGEGEHVSNLAKGEFTKYNNEKGETCYRGWSSGFKDWTFPVQFVRPEIIEATAEAMQLKVFDAIGLVGGRRKDPMIVGVVRGPKVAWSRKEIHFIIGWFLDTKTM